MGTLDGGSEGGGYDEFGITGVPVEIAKAIKSLVGFGKAVCHCAVGIEVETEVEPETRDCTRERKRGVAGVGDFRIEPLERYARVNHFPVET